MSANSRFAVALHILALLANQKRPLSSTYIAGSVNTNPVTIRQIIGILREGGLVETFSGASGGAKLTKATEQINLNDIYTLFRTEHLFGFHPEPPNPDCPIGHGIQETLLDISLHLESTLSDLLDQLSLQHFVEMIHEKNREVDL